MKLNNTVIPSKKKRPLKSGQSRFLYAFYVKHGGIINAARKLKLKPQVIENWRVRGKVPLHNIRQIINKLKLDDSYIYCFNYEEIVNLLGGGPDWVKVVKDMGFDKDLEDWVLKGEAPKAYKA